MCRRLDGTDEYEANAVVNCYCGRVELVNHLFDTLMA